MYSETYKKLKIYAASHPGALESVTKKDLDTIQLEESNVNQNDYIDGTVLFTNPNKTLRF